MRKVILGLLSLLGIVGVLFSWQYFQTQQKVKAISSFEDCAKYFPVMESYPPRCVAPDGRSFTQDIGNELEYKDEIVLDHPRPNQLINSPLRINGQARGIWYFEANFSAELFDANNKSLGTTIITAEGDWMTEGFVPFSAELRFTNPTTNTGTLKIRNANPSGLPENQKELVMPVRFE